MKTSIKELLAKGFLILDDEDDFYTMYTIPDGLVVLDEEGNHLYCIQEYSENGKTEVILVGDVTTENPLHGDEDGKLTVRIFREITAENMV